MDEKNKEEATAAELEMIWDVLPREYKRNKQQGISLVETVESMISDFQDEISNLEDRVSSAESDLECIESELQELKSLDEEEE